MRSLVLGLAFVATAVLLGQAGADAGERRSDDRTTVIAHTASSTDVSAQRRRRPARVYVYGTPRLGPNAVRQCRAWYAPEYRLSGTVITPRMQCWWQRG